MEFIVHESEGVVSVLITDGRDIFLEFTEESVEAAHRTVDAIRDAQVRVVPPDEHDPYLYGMAVV